MLGLCSAINYASCWQTKKQWPQFIINNNNNWAWIYIYWVFLLRFLSIISNNVLWLSWELFFSNNCYCHVLNQLKELNAWKGPTIIFWLQMLLNLLFWSVLTHPLSSFPPAHTSHRCKCQLTNRTLVFHYKIWLIPVQWLFFLPLSVGLNCSHIIFPFCFLSPLDNTLQDWKTLALCSESCNYTAVLTLDPTSSKKGYCLMNHVKTVLGSNRLLWCKLKLSQWIDDWFV